GSNDWRWLDIQRAAAFSYNPVCVGADWLPVIAGGVCPTKDTIIFAGNCIHQWWIIAHSGPWQVELRNNRDLAAVRFHFAVRYQFTGTDAGAIHDHFKAPRELSNSLQAYRSPDRTAGIDESIA